MKPATPGNVVDGQKPMTSARFPGAKQTFGRLAVHMVANFWPGATLEQFQVDLAQLEGKEQPQAQLLRTAAEVEGGLMIVSLWEGEAAYDRWAASALLPQIDLPGGMEGRPEQRQGLVVDHYSVLPAS
jgi:hypothetical protein